MHGARDHLLPLPKASCRPPVLLPNNLLGAQMDARVVVWSRILTVSDSVPGQILWQGSARYRLQPISIGLLQVAKVYGGLGVASSHGAALRNIEGACPRALEALAPHIDCASRRLVWNRKWKHALAAYGWEVRSRGRSQHIRQRKCFIFQGIMRHPVLSLH